MRAQRVFAIHGPVGAQARRWLALLIGLAALWLTIGVAIPAAQRLPFMGPTVRALLDSGIEVSAIYYTGVEKVSQAESAVRAATGRGRP